MQPLSFYYPLRRRLIKRFSPTLDVENKKTASYFTLTLSLLSLSFFGLFAVRPTLITATSLIKDISDLKKLNIEYENKISSVIRAQSEYEQIRDNLFLIETALPTNASFSKLAKTLERFAKMENFNIAQLQIDNAPISTLAATSQLKNLNFNLIGTGDYFSISSFLSHLLNWRRIVNINFLELTKEGSSSPSGMLRLTLRAYTFYEP